MADVIKQAPFGEYVDGNSGANIKANIDKMIALFTPSSPAALKAMTSPYFAMPSAQVCDMVVTELKAIKAKVSVG